MSSSNANNNGSLSVNISALQRKVESLSAEIEELSRRMTSKSYPLSAEQVAILRRDMQRRVELRSTTQAQIASLVEKQKLQRKEQDVVGENEDEAGALDAQGGKTTKAELPQKPNQVEGSELREQQQLDEMPGSAATRKLADAIQEGETTRAATATTNSKNDSTSSSSNAFVSTANLTDFEILLIKLHRHYGIALPYFSDRDMATDVAPDDIRQKLFSYRRCCVCGHMHDTRGRIVDPLRSVRHPPDSDCAVTCAHIFKSRGEAAVMKAPFDISNFLPLCGTLNVRPSCHHAMDSGRLCIVPRRDGRYEVLTSRKYGYLRGVVDLPHQVSKIALEAHAAWCIINHRVALTNLNEIFFDLGQQQLSAATRGQQPQQQEGQRGGGVEGESADQARRRIRRTRWENLRVPNSEASIVWCPVAASSLLAEEENKKEEAEVALPQMSGCVVLVPVPLVNSLELTKATENETKQVGQQKRTTPFSLLALRGDRSEETATTSTSINQRQQQQQQQQQQTDHREPTDRNNNSNSRPDVVDLVSCTSFTKQHCLQLERYLGAHLQRLQHQQTQDRTEEEREEATARTPVEKEVTMRVSLGTCYFSRNAFAEPVLEVFDDKNLTLDQAPATLGNDSPVTALFTTKDHHHKQHRLVSAVFEFFPDSVSSVPSNRVQVTLNLSTQEVSVEQLPTGEEGTSKGTTTTCVMDFVVARPSSHLSVRFQRWERQLPHSTTTTQDGATTNIVTQRHMAMVGSLYHLYTKRSPEEERGQGSASSFSPLRSALELEQQKQAEEKTVVEEQQQQVEASCRLVSMSVKDCRVSSALVDEEVVSFVHTRTRRFDFAWQRCGDDNNNAVTTTQLPETNSVEVTSDIIRRTTTAGSNNSSNNSAVPPPALHSIGRHIATSLFAILLRLRELDPTTPMAAPPTSTTPDQHQQQEEDGSISNDKVVPRVHLTREGTRRRANFALSDCGTQLTLQPMSKLFGGGFRPRLPPLPQPSSSSSSLPSTTSLLLLTDDDPYQQRLCMLLVNALRRQFLHYLQGPVFPHAARTRHVSVQLGHAAYADPDSSELVFSPQSPHFRTTLDNVVLPKLQQQDDNEGQRFCRIEICTTKVTTQNEGDADSAVVVDLKRWSSLAAAQHGRDAAARSILGHSCADIVVTIRFPETSRQQQQQPKPVERGEGFVEVCRFESSPTTLLAPATRSTTAGTTHQQQHEPTVLFHTRKAPSFTTNVLRVGSLLDLEICCATPGSKRLAASAGSTAFFNSAEDQARLVNLCRRVCYDAAADAATGTFDVSESLLEEIEDSVQSMASTVRRGVSCVTVGSLRRHPVVPHRVDAVYAVGTRRRRTTKPVSTTTTTTTTTSSSMTRSDDEKEKEKSAASLGLVDTAVEPVFALNFEHVDLADSDGATSAANVNERCLSIGRTASTFYATDGIVRDLLQAADLLCPRQLSESVEGDGEERKRRNVKDGETSEQQATTTTTSNRQQQDQEQERHHQQLPRYARKRLIVDLMTRELRFRHSDINFFLHHGTLDRRQVWFSIIDGHHRSQHHHYHQHRQEGTSGEDEKQEAGDVRRQLQQKAALLRHEAAKLQQQQQHQIEEEEENANGVDAVASKDLFALATSIPSLSPQLEEGEAASPLLGPKTSDGSVRPATLAAVEPLSTLLLLSSSSSSSLRPLRQFKLVEAIVTAVLVSSDGQQHQQQQEEPQQGSGGKATQLKLRWKLPVVSTDASATKDVSGDLIVAVKRYLSLLQKQQSTTMSASDDFSIELLPSYRERCIRIAREDNAPFDIVAHFAEHDPSPLPATSGAAAGLNKSNSSSSSKKSSKQQQLEEKQRQQAELNLFYPAAQLVNSLYQRAATIEDPLAHPSVTDTRVVNVSSPAQAGRNKGTNNSSDSKPDRSSSYRFFAEQLTISHVVEFPTPIPLVSLQDRLADAPATGPSLSTLQVHGVKKFCWDLPQPTSAVDSTAAAATTTPPSSAPSNNTKPDTSNPTSVSSSDNLVVGSAVATFEKGADVRVCVSQNDLCARDLLADATLNVMETVSLLEGALLNGGRGGGLLLYSSDESAKGKGSRSGLSKKVPLTTAMGTAVPASVALEQQARQVGSLRPPNYITSPLAPVIYDGAATLSNKDEALSSYCLSRAAEWVSNLERLSKVSTLEELYTMNTAAAAAGSSSGSGLLWEKLARAGIPDVMIDNILLSSSSSSSSFPVSPGSCPLKLFARSLVTVPQLSPDLCGVVLTLPAHIICTATMAAAAAGYWARKGDAVIAFPLPQKEEAGEEGEVSNLLRDLSSRWSDSQLTVESPFTSATTEALNWDLDRRIQVAPPLSPSSLAPLVSREAGLLLFPVSSCGAGRWVSSCTTAQVFPQTQLFTPFAATNIHASSSSSSSAFSTLQLDSAKSQWVFNASLAAAAAVDMSSRIGNFKSVHLHNSAPLFCSKGYAVTFGPRTTTTAIGLKQKKTFALPHFFGALKSRTFVPIV